MEVEGLEGREVDVEVPRVEDRQVGGRTMEQLAAVDLKGRLVERMEARGVKGVRAVKGEG